MKLFSLLWRRLAFGRWRLIGTVESADEVPEKLPHEGVVLVAEGAKTKWLVFDCPCRTGHRIMLNADRQRRPFWTFHQNESRLTIAPSIDYRTRERRCHYFIRNGRVVWARDWGQR